jgi:LPS-assembly protein
MNRNVGSARHTGLGREAPEQSGRSVLGLSLGGRHIAHKFPKGVSNIIDGFCHGIFARLFAGLCVGALFAPAAAPQNGAPPFVVSPNPAAPPPENRPPRVLKVTPPNQVAENEVFIQGLKQMKEGAWYRLRGGSFVQTDAFLLKADDIDWNEDTGQVLARGNVYLQHFEGGEELWCDHAEYNVNDDTGKFFEVRGQALTHIEARPHVLTSSNPFYFEGDWAERLKEKYVLHDGFITNCKMPKPWWIVRAPVFDIIPGERAISHRAVFWLGNVPVVRRIPMFYAPYYYKPLEKLPRQSGFFAPNIGNSSKRGQMVGLGYYWAINRSYDAAYRAQFFTQGALAHDVAFRGTPRHGTEFDVTLYGVQGVGVSTTNAPTNEGGFMISGGLKSDLGKGFYARAEVNYLSSFLFRQSFTQTFTEAISSEVHSIGYVTRQWSTFGLDIVSQRVENFQSTAPKDLILIHKLPEVDFSSRDRRIFDNFPLWLSWESSAGLLGRTEPDYQTRSFVERTDLHPEVTTVVHWGDFSLVPSFAVRDTHYGDSRDQFHVVGQDINRYGREANVDFVIPSLARVYKAPKWLGDQVKHVIETGAEYHYVGGVNNFNRIVRFDDTELYSNTNEVEYWIANRLYAKRNDSVEEVLSWDLRQKRFFDPTFGGAVTNWCGQPACRNMVLSEIELTPFAFLDGPRHYSPIVSALRASPRPGIGLEWRADYDPLRHNVVASSTTVDAHFGRYGMSLGHNTMKAVPALTPNANQVRGQFTIGNENRRGWNAGFQGIYDYRTAQMQFMTSQVTYNTDCCGFSFQLRRLNFGVRDEYQYLGSFSVANIGSFGTLKKQERMF